jgi:hypothetical protein
MEMGIVVKIHVPIQGHREDRWPSRGQRAIEETESCRGDRGRYRG